jgi:hypothetical protein
MLLLLLPVVWLGSCCAAVVAASQCLLLPPPPLLLLLLLPFLQLVIGRSPISWATIPDQEVSSKHASVTWSEALGGWQLVRRPVLPVLPVLAWWQQQQLVQGGGGGESAAGMVQKVRKMHLGST